MGNEPIDKFSYLHPRAPYHGQCRPEFLMFNANLQEFSHRVNHLCNLETSGKISTEDAYNEIHDLWKQLKKSKKQLGIH